MAPVACAAGDEGGAPGIPGSDVGHTTAAIVGGEPSPASDNAVVLIRNVRGECTGTLVAPNLVATARHCVSSSNLAMRCNELGQAVSGGQSGADYDPGKIAIFVGESFSRRGVLDPAAVGVRVVHDGSPTLCDHDLAFVVLSRPVTAPVAPLRLASPPRVGEKARAVGWGISVAKTPSDGRVARGGVTVAHVGANAVRATGPRELSATEGICDGDSGGPLLAESDGALLGVASRGGSPRAAKLAPPEACVGDDIVNVYTSLAAHARTVRAAFRAAGLPEPEGPPDEPCAGLVCAAPTTCQTTATGAATCATPAPSATPPEAEPGGCAVRPASAAQPTFGAALLALGLVGLFARRRRLAQ
jgi:MYXO-CTERM domain-containing protein